MMTTLLVTFFAVAATETLAMARIAGLLPIRPYPRSRVPAMVPLRVERDLIPPPLHQGR
jgi:hypothetical protein